MEKKLFENKIMPVFLIIFLLFGCSKSQKYEDVVLNDNIKNTVIDFINSSSEYSDEKDILIEVSIISKDTIARFIRTQPYRCLGYKGHILVNKQNVFLFYNERIKKLPNIIINKEHKDCGEFVKERKIDLPYEKYYFLKKGKLIEQ
ncbi:hypothetical protein [Chryseobacterium sp. A321]